MSKKKHYQQQHKQQTQVSLPIAKQQISQDSEWHGWRNEPMLCIGAVACIIAFAVMGIFVVKPYLVGDTIYENVFVTGLKDNGTITEVWYDGGDNVLRVPTPMMHSQDIAVGDLVQIEYKDKGSSCDIISIKEMPHR